MQKPCHSKRAKNLNVSIPNDFPNNCYTRALESLCIIRDAENSVLVHSQTLCTRADELMARVPKVARERVFHDTHQSVLSLFFSEKHYCYKEYRHLHILYVYGLYIYFDILGLGGVSMVT
jgi:hypothetical protein